MAEDYLQDDALSRQEIADLQVRRLRETVARAARSPWYEKALREAGVGPDDIEGVDDVRKLPLTTKDDLRAGMPYGFLAVPLDEVARMHYSSGTTGIATGVYHTSKDLRSWTECVARGMRAVGVDRSDVFQNMMGYGLFTGGLGFHYAGELLGCMTIPASAGNTRRQVHLMQTFQTTVIHILPSYALRVAAYCQEHGIDPIADLSIKYAFLGGEPHSRKLVRRIENLFDCKVYNCYGLSEMCGPGVAMECVAQDGLHVREDQYIAEVVDPETLAPVAVGEQGELVLTTLRREAMPLLRYRTMDVTRLISEPCACGSEHVKIGRLEGRTDDMLIVKGVNIYPQQIERVLMDSPQVGSNYVIVLDDAEGTDEMLVQVELTQDAFVDEMRELRTIEDALVSQLRSEILITPQVELHEPNALPAVDGKAVRVIDKRDKA